MAHLLHLPLAGLHLVQLPLSRGHVLGKLRARNNAFRSRAVHGQQKRDTSQDTAALPCNCSKSCLELLHVQYSDLMSAYDDGACKPFRLWEAAHLSGFGLKR